MLASVSLYLLTDPVTFPCPDFVRWSLVVWKRELVLLVRLRKGLGSPSIPLPLPFTLHLPLLSTCFLRVCCPSSLSITFIIVLQGMRMSQTTFTLQIISRRSFTSFCPSVCRLRTPLLDWLCHASLCWGQYVHYPTQSKCPWLGNRIIGQGLMEGRGHTTRSLSPARNFKEDHLSVKLWAILFRDGKIILSSLQLRVRPTSRQKDIYTSSSVQKYDQNHFKEVGHGILSLLQIQVCQTNGQILGSYKSCLKVDSYSYFSLHSTCVYRQFQHTAVFHPFCADLHSPNLPISHLYLQHSYQPALNLLAYNHTKSNSNLGNSFITCCTVDG